MDGQSQELKLIRELQLLKTSSRDGGEMIIDPDQIEKTKTRKKKRQKTCPPSPQTAPSYQTLDVL